MFDLKDALDVPPFSLSKDEKNNLYVEAMRDLSTFHARKCPAYGKIVQLLNGRNGIGGSVEQTPFIPVRLFKEYDLLSVEREDVVKTMTSSGTTGQRVSKIFLDRDTSVNQTKVLVKIMSSFIGVKRLPMLIIDSRTVIKDRNLFSARGAGILGFSMLGFDVTYALDENMELDLEAMNAFCSKHKDEPVLVFGFTYMIWDGFVNHLEQAGIRLDLDNGIMIHGGGWKKLIERAVDNETFKKHVQNVSGISKIHNYYGMVEQTGSIFMECESGHLHASIFSDVLIRDYTDFSVLGYGQTGLVQLLSLLPTSYPGHSILSEDLGDVLGEDDCSCGRKGKYFRIHGRIKNAEIRGCSDTSKTR